MIQKVILTSLGALAPTDPYLIKLQCALIISYRNLKSSVNYFIAPLYWTTFQIINRITLQFSFDIRCHIPVYNLSFKCSQEYRYPTKYNCVVRDNVSMFVFSIQQLSAVFSILGVSIADGLTHPRCVEPMVKRTWVFAG